MCIRDSHQANYRIIESIAKRLKVNVDRFPVNMEHYGNTSGASVPILLDEMNRKGMLSAGDKVDVYKRQDISGLLDYIHKVKEENLDIRECLDFMQMWYRDCLLYTSRCV